MPYYLIILRMFLLSWIWFTKNDVGMKKKNKENVTIFKLNGQIIKQ